VPWALVERAAPDLLSFDLTLGLDDTGAAAIRRLVAGGTRIAWGVLDAHRPEGDADAAALLDDALARTGVTGDRSLLTPTCGSGLATVAREAALAEGLRAVSRRAAGRAARPARRRS
jgi:23S rRNA G2445 N2-methylase RlmL